MLTPEEIITLAPYEKHLRNALSDFMCNPGRTAIKTMDEIYRRATGYPISTDSTCGRCILATMKRLAVLYFESKGKNEETVKPTPKVGKNKRKTAKEVPMKH